MNGFYVLENTLTCPVVKIHLQKNNKMFLFSVRTSPSLKWLHDAHIQNAIKTIDAKPTHTSTSPMDFYFVSIHKIMIVCFYTVLPVG